MARRKGSFPRLWIGLAAAVLALVLLAFIALPVADTPAPEEALLLLNHRLLPEASGMAVSGRFAGRIWFVNDSGNAAELIALDLAQERYQQFPVSGARNRDWEDLARFDHGGRSWLAIGDIGDNRARRESVQVYLLPEPADATGSPVSVDTTLVLRYPDGPRDAESLAVDPQTLQLYLLSKRDPLPRLYRTALPAPGRGARQEVTLEYLGEVTGIPELSEVAGERGERRKYSRQPTAMDFMPDAQAIALLTYSGAYVARLDDSRDWLRALNGDLCPLQVPALRQAETIAAAGGWHVLVSSEGKQAPVYRLAANCDR
jgi:hypothetical protein